MLQRVPVILAVTANSYGLTVQSGSRKAEAAGQRKRQERTKNANDKPQAHE